MLKTKRFFSGGADEIGFLYGIKHKKFFMKRDVLEGIFTISKEDNLELYNMGLESIENG